LLQAIASCCGVAPEATEIAKANPHVLVTGCHTDRIVLAISVFLRRALGIDSVGVSPHLCAGTTPEAHFAAMRHGLPGAGVQIHLDLADTYKFVGLTDIPDAFEHGPCHIEPPEVRTRLGHSAERIVQMLCMHWSRTEARPLAGGFSGSHLLLADGWRGSARAEPLVLKIDRYEQMRRELAGYYQVKDLLGKHVPTFGYPVEHDESIGVAMELAAMEGRPQTLQDSYESADSDAALTLFSSRLQKALSLLTEKLYRNTMETDHVSPYRAFGLHAEKQLVWLKENADIILGYLSEIAPDAPKVAVDQLVQVVRVVSRNEDSLETEVCVSHGDLNYANVICDAVDNIWFIDWTHSGYAPIELDFAKLESDAKFVMSKDFEADDLARLRELEEVLSQHRVPPSADQLPNRLKFVKWDLRFRKILDAVRSVRQHCFDLKSGDEEWIVYRVALLKYALHTLSFDERRGRGECKPVQLTHALYAAEALAMELISDDFHLKIRGERPPEYPPRQRISIDESPWMFDCDEYSPPYYVHPSVLEADRMVVAGGWADPEDTALVADRLASVESRHRDESGRPLHPRGRTGLQGRGLLGLWGENRSVIAVVTRSSADADNHEVLLGRQPDSMKLELPRGFVLPGEETTAALERVLEAEFGLAAESSEPSELFEGVSYDARQTDHAWVVACAFHVECDREMVSARSDSGTFEEIHWWPLSADTINQIPTGQSDFVRMAVEKMGEVDRISPESVEEILSRTG
jgi:ADP-ribose pyrophosphatase